MKLGTWILALCEPLLAKILLSLGFSVVTITGLTAVANTLKSQFVNTVNTLPADIINLFLLSGGGLATGIIFGALTTRLALWSIQNGTKILGVNPGS